MKSKIWMLLIASTIVLSCKKETTNPGTDNNAGGTVTVIAESSVPAVVVNSFNSSFSGATEVEWHKSGEHGFEVEFNHENERHEAEFDDNGHESSHTVICTDGAVPAVVLDAFRSAFPADNVYEWKLNNDGTWKAHFMRGSVKWEATYTADGSQVKVEHE